LKIAVSVNNNEEIVSHLGKAKIFYIFSKDKEEISFIESRVTEGNHENHIIEDIKDCNTVISGKIGTGMVESLKKLGIKAITEKSTLNPVKAIAKI